MIIFINGTLGIGKTSVANYLLWNNSKAVMLEGDALCNINPFQAYDKKRIDAVFDIIQFMIKRYKEIGYEIFIIDNILEKENEIEKIHNSLTEIDKDIFCFLLYCKKNQREQYIQKRRRQNYLWELERSEELNQKLLLTFKNSKYFKKIDTTALTIEEIGKKILEKIKI